MSIYVKQKEQPDEGCSFCFARIES